MSFLVMLNPCASGRPDVLRFSFYGSDRLPEGPRRMFRTPSPRQLISGYLVNRSSWSTRSWTLTYVDTLISSGAVSTCNLCPPFYPGVKSILSSYSFWRRCATYIFMMLSFVSQKIEKSS